MKMKSLLSFFVPAAMMSLMVAGCSDYDNGYDSNAIKFNEEFRKAYGDIDPEQDWNLAERGTVTVSTMKESEVKIYALRGNEYVLVGDYEGVKGTKMLGFDMVEGTNSIMVTDGVTAEKTVPGGVVAFGDTRTTHASEGYVKVHKLEGPVTLEDGKTYEKYRYNTETEYKKVTKETVEQGKVNLSRVINNFSYVSNGPFIIYPYYWYTSSTNTVGVYYYDNNGELQEVPIYTTKGNNDGEEPELISYELFYEDDGQVWDNSSEGYPSTPNWQTNNGVNPGGDNFKGNAFDTKSSESGMTQPFTEYWFPASQSQTLQPGQITRVFNNFTPGERYRVEIKARLWNGNKNGDPKGVKFFLNDANSNSVDLSANKTVTYYEETPLVYGTYSLEFVADENGAVTVGFDIADDRLGNWLTFKDLKIFHMKEKHEWTSTNGKEFFNGITRGQGIYVDIPKGTQFGMYLHSVNIAGEEITYYSQAELNTASPDGKPEDEMYGYGVKYKGSGVITDKANWEKDADLYPCYASTFNVDGQMFFGFEDWRNPTNGDMDLNDVVLAISGFDPTVINEDPTENSWLLVCEDLGGSFDTDYNDVIFKVDHVSGQPTAKVTAMAAGGTLASYIFFRDPTTQNAQDQVVGEIHQMFGVAPESSGEYAPINATTRYEKGGNTVSIDVGENWTLAYYQADQFHQGSVGNYGENVNMGGFQIRTLKSGTPDPGVNVNANTGVFNSSSTASVIAAPDKGAAPYILCLPYTYTKPVGNKLNTYVWAWPQELCTICSAVYDQNDKYSGSNGGAYREFGEWVRDHSKNVEWYKNRNVNALTVEELLLKSEDIQTGELQIRESLVLADGRNAAVDLSQNVIPAAGGGDVTYNILSFNRSNKISDVGSSFTFTNGAGIVQVIQNGVTKEFTVKFKSPLGNKGNMTVHKANGSTGIQVDLASNLTNANVSSGALSYEYGHATLHASPTDWLYNKGPRTITVTQAADDDYVAGTTTFTLTIINDDEIGAQTFNVPGTISSAAFTIENGSENGKYNVKYNGEPVLNNVTSITFSWSNVLAGNQTGNPMSIFSPSSSVQWTDDTYEADEYTVQLDNHNWGNGEEHKITANPYNGTFTLSVTGR